MYKDRCDAESVGKGDVKKTKTERGHLTFGVKQPCFLPSPRGESAIFPSPPFLLLNPAGSSSCWVMARLVLPCGSFNQRKEAEERRGDLRRGEAMREGVIELKLWCKAGNEYIYMHILKLILGEIGLLCPWKLTPSNFWVLVNHFGSKDTLL